VPSLRQALNDSSSLLWAGQFRRACRMRVNCCGRPLFIATFRALSSHPGISTSASFAPSAACLPMASCALSIAV